MDDKKIAKMRKPELLKLISELDKTVNRQQTMIQTEKKYVKLKDEMIKGMSESYVKVRENQKKFNMYLTLIETGLHCLDEELLTQREFILLCQCVHGGRNQQFHKEVFDTSDEVGE